MHKNKTLFENRIAAIIKDELNRMCQKYGDTFNTDHEAFAVTLEEIEEARDNIVLVDSDKQKIWEMIKNNHPTQQYWVLLYMDTLSAIQELVQVAACCIKATREKGAK